MYFQYGKKEIDYLKSKDSKLKEVIDKLGYIKREVDSDLFSSVIHNIIGQQISTKALKTIWQRLNDKVDDIKPENITEMSIEDIKNLGMTYRKAEYIKDFTSKIMSGEFDIDALNDMSDEEIIKELSNLKGIGKWTAEMIMTFSMQRPDIVSYGDLAILRGMRMLYHHRKITPELFNKYKRRYSPYGTVASLYLWAIAGGKVEGMKDYAPLTDAEKRKRRKAKINEAK